MNSRMVIVLLLCGLARASNPTGPSNSAAESDAKVTTKPSGASLRLRLVGRPQERKRTDDEESDIEALAESVDEKLLAWGDARGTIRLYSFARKKKRSTILDLSHLDSTARRTVRDLAFDDKGALWWLDASCDVYHAQLTPGKDARIRKVATVPRGPVFSANLLPWGVLMTTSVWEGVKWWPPRDVLVLQEVDSGKLHSSPVLFPNGRGVDALVQHAVRSPDGKLLMAVAFGDATLLSLPDLKIVRRFGQRRGVSAAFSPSSRRVALGTDGRGVFVWETKTGRLVKKVPFRRASSISSLVFVGEDIVYAADFPMSRIDLRSGRTDPVALVNGRVLLVSRSGRRLFVGIHEGGVAVFDLPAIDHPQDSPRSQPAGRATK